MKILWIANMILPDVQHKRNAPVSSSGWWLDTMSKKLAKCPDVELTVLSLAPGETVDFQEKIGHILHIILPVTYADRQIKPSSELMTNLQQMITHIQPDIIHLQGSELTTNLAVFEEKICPVVLSVQGLISEIVKKDYSYPLLKKSIVPSAYLMERVKHWKNKKRAASEIFQLQQAEFVIGRTLWDRAHTYFHNPKAKYFYLQECIRESFSTNQWELSKAEPCTIFCAGGLASPLKGFHHILEAAALLKEEFPNLKIKVCAKFREHDKYGYHRYLKKWIQKLEMNNHIEFLGQLDEKAMCEQFLKSRMYVMGSSIENSSNTLAEAMCLGVPSVVPFVGGVPSLATDEKEALYYRFEDTELLAYQMRRILLDDVLAEKLSVQARERAEKQYATDHLAEDLVKIYQEIFSKS